MELLENSDKNIYNLSIIELTKCEAILKTKYHINENDSLIIVKNEVISDKASEKSVNYEIYEPYNKTKLNISLCDGTSINLYVPMELSKDNKQIYEQMKESGYDMFNINDPFYQDICTPFDSANGTDILLSDRKDFIYNNDDTQCQPNCQLSQYSLESKYLNCSCSTNKNSNDANEKKDEFTAKKIYESFYEVLKYSNYNIIKCYKLIWNINVITINIGSIIVIIYFACYLICMLIYIFRGLIPLRIKLRNDINELRGKNDEIYRKEILNILYPPIKKHHILKLSLNQNNNATKKKTNKKENYKIDLSNQKLVKDQIEIYSYKNHFPNKLNYDKSRNLKINDELKIKRNENIITRYYSDYELNELEYRKKLWSHRPLTDFWRVGRGIAKRLEHLELYTMGDIARCSLGSVTDKKNEDGSIEDFKFFCFNGKYKALCVDKDRYSNHIRGFWDENLQYLDDVKSDHENIKNGYQLPQNIKEMISVAEKLSDGFPFVRVDLYNIEGKVYFGELTFYPWSGYVNFYPDSFDFKLGSYFTAYN